jgi:hypothetical protein
MCKIFIRHQIPPGFLDILCGFGDKSHTADEGCASGVYSSLNGASHDIFYQFWYVEKNNRKHGDPWSVRQTGVYHRFSITDSLKAENFWLLLHPMPNSKAQTRMRIATEKLGEDEMVRDPLRLHVLIMSSYVDNWRWYLHDIKRQYTELVSLEETAPVEMLTFLTGGHTYDDRASRRSWLEFRHIADTETFGIKAHSHSNNASIFYCNNSLNTGHERSLG